MQNTAAVMMSSPRHAEFAEHFEERRSQIRRGNGAAADHVAA
jgi:hypothetical protein